MNGYFEIERENVRSVFEGARRIAEEAPERTAGSDGERRASDMIFNEIEPYCDEAEKVPFLTYPGAASFCRKGACVLMTLAALLFKASQLRGNALLSCAALVCSLSGFCLFSYKFLFGGRKLDSIFRGKHSQNLFLTRHARSTPLLRVVLSAKSDTAPKLNTPFFGKKAPTVFSALCFFSNTLTFCFVCAYLFTGAMQSTRFFGTASDFSLFLCVFYCLYFFLYDKKPSDKSGNSLIPALCTVEIMKKLFSESVRFPNTEVCVLITGADFPCHDGATQFASRKKRAFRDVPTVFISVEEITSAQSKAVFFDRGSNGEKASEAVISAAKSCGVKITAEPSIFGSSVNTPFESAGFAASSFGASKTLSKTSQASETAVEDALNILKDTVKFYGNAR